jgi:hypothetical protein
MSHIVSPARYPSKKAFKEAVTANPEAVYVDDPSLFDPCSGSVAHILERHGSFTVTNHPKRSWYAAVTRKNGIANVS